MGNKWIKLAELSATAKPYERTDYGDGVDRRRYDSPQIGRLHRKKRERDRARDRDQENESDRKDYREDVDRGEDR